MNKDITDNITYPIVIQYDSDKVVPLEKLPDRIKVNATGYGWKLLRKSLIFHNGPLVIRPENLPDKNYLTASQMLPAVKQELSDVRVNYIVSDTLHFNFDRKVTKTIQLKVDSGVLNLAQGYRLVSSIMIQPDTVVFSGPKSIVSKLPDTLQLNVPGKNIKESYAENIKIEHVFNSLIKYEPKEARVSFESALYVQESKMLVPRQINFPGDTSYIVPDKQLIITYQVREEHKNKAKEEDFRAVLNFRKLNLKDTTIVPELLIKPEFIKDFYFTPSAVKIKHVKKTS
ncbi:MAG: hypothetical protein ACK4ND_17600 [Cytophagaceae bacterium]